MTKELQHIEQSEGRSEGDKALFGFWAYIMSDCLLFACLFASYAVLRNATAGGPSSYDIFSLPFVLVETLILLTSSFTYGLVSYYAHHENHKQKVLLWLGVTLALGAAFVSMEIYEFAKLIHEGYGPDRSAFLSSFFALIGTHGLHVTLGIIWMLVLFVQIVRLGVNTLTLKKIAVLGIFWHFLDIIWIFIFTIVYLMGVL